MRKEIKEGDLVLVRPNLFEDKQLGFVYKKERKMVKHVIDPRVPELTKEKEEDWYAVWVFEQSTSFWHPEHQLFLLEDAL